MSPCRRYYITDEGSKNCCKKHGADPQAGRYHPISYDISSVPNDSAEVGVALAAKISDIEITVVSEMARDLPALLVMFLAAPFTFVYNCIAHVTTP